MITDGPAPVAVLTATAAVIDGAWYASVALAMSSTSWPARLRTHAARYDRLLGTILLLAAGWMLARSL